MEERAPDSTRIYLGLLYIVTRLTDFFVIARRCRDLLTDLDIISLCPLYWSWLFGIILNHGVPHQLSPESMRFMGVVDASGG